MILNQANFDGAVLHLLSKISIVCVLTMESNLLVKLPFTLEIFTTMARRTSKSAEFIVRYSETKSLCKSVPTVSPPRTQCGLYREKTKQARREGPEIENYSAVLEGIMQQF
jgi:hypothetical protein